jgi:hypothetical protein
MDRLLNYKYIDETLILKSADESRLVLYSDSGEQKIGSYEHKLISCVFDMENVTDVCKYTFAEQHCLYISVNGVKYWTNPIIAEEHAESEYISLPETFQNTRVKVDLTIKDLIPTLSINDFYKPTLKEMEIGDHIIEKVQFNENGVKLEKIVFGKVNGNKFHESEFYWGTETIVLPTNIEVLGRMPGGLTSIIIPNSVRSIVDSAFEVCTSLSSITLSNGLTSIGNGAFSECYSLSMINIPSGVTSIGYYAFSECDSLYRVNIPSGVTSIGDYVFFYCDSLSNITVENGNPNYDSRDNCNALIETATNTLLRGCSTTVIPNSVTSIGNGAFSECYSLSMINIPSGVTSIGDYAFSYCDSLSSITIPYSVTSIRNEAFRKCTSLTSITIPSGVTSIGDYAFEYCDSLTSITCDCKTPPTLGKDVFEKTSSQGILITPFDTDYSTFFEQLKSGWTQSISITLTNGDMIGFNYEDGIIPESAFIGRTDIESVIFYSGITEIQDDAFNGCTNLKGLQFYSETPPTIGTDAFEGIDANCHVIYPQSDYSELFDLLETKPSVTYTRSDGTVETIEYLDGIVDNSSEDLYDITDAVINNNIWKIEESAFNSCELLTSVTIPNSVREIGNEAFSYCSSLTDFIIPNGVETIGANVFSNCTTLQHVTLPNTVSGIGMSAFNDCASLEDIVIPNGVTTIDTSTFFGCISLQSVTLPSGLAKIMTQAFYGCTALTDIVIPSGVTNIYSYAFKGCSSLSSITCENETVPTLGSQAFDGVAQNGKLIYPNLTDYTTWFQQLPENWRPSVVYKEYGSGDYIKEYYLDGVMKPQQSMTISALTINYGVKKIESGETVSCGDYIDLILHNNVEYIGDGAFQQWLFKDIVLGENTKTIGNYAFYQAETPHEIIIPNGVTSIGDYAFAETYLSALTIPNSVSYLGEYAFSNNLLEFILLPNNLTEIKEGLLYCNEFKKIIIPNSVTSIGDSAFEECYYLSSITLSNNLTIIDEAAFMDCGSLTDIVIPSGVTSIGSYAFESSYSLSSITCDCKNPPTLGEDVFNGISTYGKIYIPKGSDYSDWKNNVDAFAKWIFVEK